MRSRRNPQKKNVKRNAKLRLYKTGEKTDMGRDVFRKIGDEPSRSPTTGLLLGEYFVGEGFHDNLYKDEEGYWRGGRYGGILSARDQYLLDNNMPTGEMYSVGAPYKRRDGEPHAPIYDFEIVTQRNPQNPMRETGGGYFQMGNNDHQTAEFIGTVDPKWVVQLRGQNNEHRLFDGGEGTGRYSEADWQSLLNSIEKDGFMPEGNGAFIIVEFGKNGKKTRDADTRVTREMLKRYGDEWGYPMEAAAALIDPDTDIIATVYEGNHRARAAYQLGIPLPLEMRFFGGSHQFLKEASPSSPLGIVYQMIEETGAI